MKRPIFRQPPLSLLLTVAFTVAGAFVAALIIFTLFINFRNELRQELRNRLISITSVAALQQDGDTLIKVAARNDEYYNKINQQNLKIRASDPDLAYVYTMRKNEQGIYFIVDANLPGDEGIADFGQPYLEPSPTLEQNFDTLDHTIIEPDFYTDEFGSFLSAYAPIYASTGEKVGVLGVDINANRVLEKEQRFLNRSLFIFFASLPIITLLGYLLGRQLSIPLVQITRSAQQITEGNLSEAVIEPQSPREAALLANSFNRMAQKLAELINNLEKQVAERAQKAEKRAAELQTVARVARAIATLRETNLLLPEITRLISEQFGFYHVGIFLLDENREYAVLSAANSPGGQRMLKRQHKLRLDMKSIVGYTAARGEARIALDVGSDSVFFNNPDLPETRSEMALPLRTGERVIGVLDVQSTQPNAFTEEDINVLATLADQVAVAIENARLFSEARQALQESEQTFARYIKQEWSSFARRAKTTGYLFDGQRAAPLQEKNGHASLAALPQTGRLSMEGESDTLTIPLRVKGQIIGALKVRPKTSRQWRDDELTLLETAAERAALALENARLVDSAQRRASRERLISEISSKVGAVSEMDTIMQTAVEELGRRLGSAAEVILELEKD